jgi:hypothetical protein
LNMLLGMRIDHVNAVVSEGTRAGWVVGREALTTIVSTTSLLSRTRGHEQMSWRSTST